MSQPPIDVERVVREVLAMIGVARKDEARGKGEGGRGKVDDNSSKVEGGRRKAEVVRTPEMAEEEGRAVRMAVMYSKGKPVSLDTCCDTTRRLVAREEVVADQPQQSTAAQVEGSPGGSKNGKDESTSTPSSQSALTRTLSGHRPRVGRERELKSTAGGELVVSSRVVTMAQVAGRLDGVRRLVVLRQAVITPVVRDELLHRGIAIAYADSPEGLAATVRLVLVAAPGDFDAAPLLAALSHDGFRVECSSSDCLVAAVDRLAQEVLKADTLGVLATTHAAAGACLANRAAGVRAIAEREPAAVAGAAAAVGANILLVDPQAMSFFRLRQAIIEFARGGVRPCPEVFRNRLG